MCWPGTWFVLTIAVPAGVFIAHTGLGSALLREMGEMKDLALGGGVFHGGLRDLLMTLVVPPGINILHYPTPSTS